MQNIKNSVISFVVIAILVGLTSTASYMGGKYSATYDQLQNTPKDEITSEIIINRITDNSFLVTKTLYLDQEATIKYDQGSDFDNLLWGNEIETEAIVRSDIGVDFQKLDTDEVKVDHTNKTIKILLPRAEVLDTSIYGEIKIKSKSGIIESIKKLFEDDKSREYNQASNKLKQLAEDEITSDTKIIQDAEDQTTKFIKILLEPTGYQIEFEPQSKTD